MKKYKISEIFYSLQGEGVHAGEPMVFVRFAGCNMKCSMKAGPLSPGGFNCDTPQGFMVKANLTAHEIALQARSVCSPYRCKRIVFTGGEPLLQLDKELSDVMREAGHTWQAIETNGTLPIPEGVELEWVCVSPKADIKLLCLEGANEIKIVLSDKQEPPECVIGFNQYGLLSPAWDLDDNKRQRNVEWCISKCLENPIWRLSIQQHKIWGIS